MATATYDSQSTVPTDTGDLSNTTNYVGGALAAASDTLRIDTSGDRAISAGLNAYAAINLGKIIVDGFIAAIGDVAEPLTFLSCTILKFAGLGKAYFQGDAPIVQVHSTGQTGEIHIQSDGGATPVQDFNVIYAMSGRLFIDNLAPNPTKIKDIHVFPGAEVTIAAGVAMLASARIVFHDGGVVNDFAGGDKTIEGAGGTYRLKGSASLSAATPRTMGVRFEHLSSGDAGDLDIIGGGRLVTVDNTVVGTAGAVRRFPGGVHDLDDASSGVTATSKADVVEPIAA